MQHPQDERAPFIRSRCVGTTGLARAQAMAHDQRTNVDQSALSKPCQISRGILKIVAGPLDQVFLGGSLVSYLCVKQTGIVRKTFAEPLVAIGPPQHKVPPPLVRSFMRDEGIRVHVCAIGFWDHDRGRESLTVSKRVIYAAEDRIRIVPEKRAEVANGIIHFRENEVLFDSATVGRQ